jgi:hypothetical protein
MSNAIFGISIFVVGVPVALALIGSIIVFATALAVARAENSSRAN